jgi:hypothetical protein
MKKMLPGKNYFFVDESGDPTFYDKHKRLIVGNGGCSSIFLLGFIHTRNPDAIRSSISNLRKEISNNKYYEGIPSLKKTLNAFHAKDDIPEIRERMYQLILSLDFKAEFVVARKIGNIFASSHNNNPNDFYDNLVSKLFENKLHLYEKNIIYFDTRGSKTRQAPLERAIKMAKDRFENKWNTKINVDIQIMAQQPKGEPCLQVIDYMNWAIYRAYTKKEIRFYKFMEKKISFLLDIYDFKKYPRNHYHKKNKLELKKMSPL